MAIKKPKRLTIGWRERVNLPEFGIRGISAKTDTGARSSSLHAYDIEEFENQGNLWIQFYVRPSRKKHNTEILCRAEVLDVRRVKNSGGQSTRRYFIRTELELGNQRWAIDLSLADRKSMGYRMLLGRTAMQDRFLVKPDKSYLTRDAHQ